MLRKIVFVVAVGLAVSVLAPISTEAAPMIGAFAPTIGSDVVQVSRCWRNAYGRLVCVGGYGYYPGYRGYGYNPGYGYGYNPSYGYYGAPYQPYYGYGYGYRRW